MKKKNKPPFHRGSALMEAICRTESDWQLSTLTNWGILHPEPKIVHMGFMGPMELVPTPCRCTRCETPALIFPDASEKGSGGFCICPKCSTPEQERKAA